MPKEKTLNECFRSINFSKNESNYWEGKGISHLEPWGRWSDSGIVTLRFDRPLPSQMRLMLRAHAFGPNAKKEFAVMVGKQSQLFTLYEDRDEDVWFEFDQVLNEREIRITVPEPVSPLSLGLGADARMLGIGLVELNLFGYSCALNN